METVPWQSCITHGPMKHRPDSTEVQEYAGKKKVADGDRDARHSNKQQAMSYSAKPILVCYENRRSCYEDE